MINSRKIEDLHPILQVVFLELRSKCYDRGIKIILTSTLRDDEYQAELYAQGRTKPGSVVTNMNVTGAHGLGLAFDVVPVTAGLGNQEVAVWNNNAWWDIIGREGKKLGLVWGGDWKSFVDKPHFEYTDGLTFKDLRAGKRPVWFKRPIEKITTIPEWKLVPLQNLYKAGIINDYELWSGQLDEPLPAWAAFAIMEKILKEVKK